MKYNMTDFDNLDDIPYSDSMETEYDSPQSEQIMNQYYPQKQINKVGEEVGTTNWKKLIALTITFVVITLPQTTKLFNMVPYVEINFVSQLLFRVIVFFIISFLIDRYI